MRVVVYDYSTGKKEVVAELKLMKKELKVMGRDAKRWRETIKDGLLNIAEGKQERVYPDRPKLFLQNMPYNFSGSVLRAELVYRPNISLTLVRLLAILML